MTNGGRYGYRTCTREHAVQTNDREPVFKSETRLSFKFEMSLTNSSSLKEKQDGKKRKSSDQVTSSDLEAIKDTHEFIRDDDYDRTHCDDWRVRLARRYHDKLYKEYAIIDLSKYREKAYGLRWRTEEEVLGTKGQLVCGSNDCDSTRDLRSYELPFRYTENDQTKRALVKVRLCSNCFPKLKHVSP